MTERKRYVLIGTGVRSEFYYGALAQSYRDTAVLTAFCDINRTRMNYANQLLENKYAHPAVATYTPDRFDEMIRTEKPDVAIVCSIDRTHHHYIMKAMKAGCDVICEKPMTIDEEKCQAILDTIKETGKKLRVTFNYRYSPYNTKVRELIMDNAIGQVHSVHFEWLLDTLHGADYFHRWHRDKRNSGGLLVHKATHHFDLVNFWLGSRPATVFAMGDLMFYGRANAEQRGGTEFYHRSFGSEYAQNDPFAYHLDRRPDVKAMYLDAEHEDGYIRDLSAFGDGISIEDTMGVLVRYENKAILTYSLNAYLPWEGFQVVFNGSAGRIELKAVERVFAQQDVRHEGLVKERSIRVFPMFGPSYDVPVEVAVGGHGGGDPRLQNDLFGPPQPDRFHRAASHIEGTWSILTGIAGNRSMRTGLPVDVASLVRF